MSKIVREMENLGESEISSETIGERVMEHLRELDDVAYVRFASVYRNFREPKDFEDAIAELSGDEDGKAPAPRASERMPLRRRPSLHAACAGARPARPRQRLAEPGGRRGRGRRTASWSAAAGRSPAAGRMPRPRRCGAPGAAARGATLYATLEPCSHHGKTPPCADAIVAAGIARVVSAIEDPNPEVAGRGMRGCAQPGSRSMIGLRANEAARDHDGHIRRIRDGRPHVTLKLAVSADGKVALAGRKPVAITGEAASARVHLMRAMHDAILVGIGTALSDDPLLTCRLPGLVKRSPVRVVLDARCVCRWLASGGDRARNAGLGYCRGGRARRQRQVSAQAGVEVLPRRGQAAARDRSAVALRRWRSAGITRLLVEGGPAVAASLVQCRSCR